ncbi:MAG: hypothetical protein KAR32_05195, partial [Candidatus Omnitrophica bacterium]|nr:hypothetical protein [Candidatus Omnitrophota bacterium]
KVKFSPKLKGAWAKDVPVYINNRMLPQLGIAPQRIIRINLAIEDSRIHPNFVPRGNVEVYNWLREYFPNDRKIYKARSDQLWAMYRNAEARHGKKPGETPQWRVKKLLWKVEIWLRDGDRIEGGLTWKDGQFIFRRQDTGEKTEKQFNPYRIEQDLKRLNPKAPEQIKRGIVDSAGEYLKTIPGRDELLKLASEIMAEARERSDNTLARKASWYKEQVLWKGRIIFAMKTAFQNDGYMRKYIINVLAKDARERGENLSLKILWRILGRCRPAHLVAALRGIKEEAHVTALKELMAAKDNYAQRLQGALGDNRAANLAVIELRDGQRGGKNALVRDKRWVREILKVLGENYPSEHIRGAKCSSSSPITTSVDKGRIAKIYLRFLPYRDFIRIIKEIVSAEELKVRVIKISLNFVNPVSNKLMKSLAKFLEMFKHWLKGAKVKSV